MSPLRERVTLSHPERLHTGRLKAETRDPHRPQAHPHGGLPAHSQNNSGFSRRHPPGRSDAFDRIFAPQEDNEVKNVPLTFEAKRLLFF